MSAKNEEDCVSVNQYLGMDRSSSLFLINISYDSEC